MENFVDPVAVLEGAGALARVADADTLAAWVSAMLTEPDRRAAMARAGTQAASRYADLPGQVAAMLSGLIDRKCR